MHNLDHAKDNLATMKRHFEDLDIKDVTVLEDSSYGDMDQAFKAIHKKCIEADEVGSKKKLLLYVYASTHGIMYDGATKTQIVFNETEISQRYYKL